MESIAAGRLTKRLSVLGPARLPRQIEGLGGAARNACGSSTRRTFASNRSRVAAEAICKRQLERGNSSPRFPPFMLPSSQEIFTTTAAVLLRQSTFTVEGAPRSPLWRRRNVEVRPIHSANTEPTPEKLEEKSRSASGSPNKSSPPVLTIITGLLVFGVVFWALKSVLFWAVGSLYVWLTGVLLS